MTRMTKAVLAAAALVAAAGATALAPTARAQGGDPPPAAKSTSVGVYTTEQASRGEVVYKAKCLECHVPADYTGDAFASKFVGGTTFDMLELIRSTMPQNDPGSLTREQYTDLVAYFFSINALPAGTVELPTDKDAQKAIKVEAKPPLTHTITRSRIHHGSPHIR